MTSIATLGSHCALQVLKGAKDEGIKSILVCEKKRESLYRRFSFIDELILVDSFSEILDEKCSSILEKNNAILIPLGTFSFDSSINFSFSSLSDSQRKMDLFPNIGIFIDSISDELICEIKVP